MSKKTTAPKKTAPKRAKPAVAEKLFSPNWQSWGGSSLGTYDAFGGQREPSKSELVAAYTDVVYAATKLIQRKISRVKLRLYVKTETGQARPKCKTAPLSRKQLKNVTSAKSISFSTQLGEVIEHPLLDLLNKANPFHNRGELIGLTQLFLDLTGNAYWLIEKDEFGLPCGLYPLPSQNVDLLRDEDLIVCGVRYHEGDREYIYDIDDIIHFKEDNPGDVYGEGYSALRAMWQRVNVGWKEISYLDNTLSNNARPDVMVSPKTDNGFGQGEAERLAKDFGHRFRGSGNGGVYVATDPVEFEILQWQPKDLAELELYKNIKISILNGLHIPPELFEIGEANRSTAEAAIYSLYANCIKPRIELIVDKLNEKLIPFYDERLFIHFDEVVPEDKNFDLAERDMLLKNGVITRAEARQLYGFEEHDWADEPLIPSGMLPTPPEAPLLPEPLPQVDHGPDPAQVSQTVLTLQEAYYTGQLPREAVLAQAVLVLKMPRDQAEALFPEKPPTPPAPVEPAPVQPVKAQTKAEVNVLDVPDIRQQGDDDCGAASTMAVCAFFGVGPKTEPEFAEALGTGDNGTSQDAIINMLEGLGLSVEAKQGMTTDDLSKYVAAGSPVIVPIQDYGGIQDEERDRSGHYVVVIGVNGDTITLQDPAAGRVEVTADNFVNNWHDHGDEADVQFGIAVTRTTKKSGPTKKKSVVPPMKDKAPDVLVAGLNEFFAHQRATVLGQKCFDGIETKAIPDTGFFDLDKWTDEMFEKMLPLVEIYYDHGAKETVARLGGDAALMRVVQPNLQEAVARATLLFCRSTNESTARDLTTALDDLRKQIAEGLEVGDVKNEMKNRVQSVFNGLDNERAYMIGHTEASRAQHNAQMITAKESGVAKAKRWILSSDACPQCKPLAGKTVGLDEAFATVGRGPYGEVTSPPRHPLCRCAMSLVVEGVND